MTKYTLPNYDAALKFVQALTSAGNTCVSSVSLAAPELFRVEGPVEVKTTAPLWLCAKVAKDAGFEFLPNKKPWERG